MPPLDPGAFVVSIERCARPGVVGVVDLRLQAELADDLIVLRGGEPLAERENALILRFRLLRRQLLDFRLDFATCTGFSTGFFCTFGLGISTGAGGGVGFSSISRRTTRCGTSWPLIHQRRQRDLRNDRAQEQRGQQREQR